MKKKTTGVNDVGGWIVILKKYVLNWSFILIQW